MNKNSQEPQSVFQRRVSETELKLLQVVWAHYSARFPEADEVSFKDGFISCVDMLADVVDKAKE